MDAASEWVKARRRACEADLKQLPIPSKRVQGNKLPHGGIRQNSARAGRLAVYNRGGHSVGLGTPSIGEAPDNRPACGDKRD
jgi:hypothetical protein